MRKIILLIAILSIFALPVSANESEVPEAPEDALIYMPEDTESFGEGLLYVIRAGLNAIAPALREAGTSCLSIAIVAILTGTLSALPGATPGVMNLSGILAVSLALLKPSDVLIQLGCQTIQEITEYGKLLVPVMASAMAAEGGVSSATTLYAGTTFLNLVLSELIVSGISPCVYAFLVLSIARHLTQQEILIKTQKFLKWIIVWTLKLILYVFTGFMTITGVVSGATDAATLKATKLTISGMVPVVGNILSDASEAILVSARVMKNTAGTYGLIAFAAILLAPFLKIGVQYLMLKLSAGIGGSFATKPIAGVIQDFSTAMGFVLAMTGSVCLLQLISVVCFMKGFA